MNRERLLFAGVVAILALWYFVMREVAVPTLEVEPQTMKVEVLDVRGAEFTPITLSAPKDSASPMRPDTHAEDHPRPPLPTPAARDLHVIWPPTSRTVATHLLGRLRHPSPPPVEGEATIEFPTPGEEEGVEGTAAPIRDRLDSWVSFNQPGQGQVVGFLVNGGRVSQPRELPEVGEIEGFWKLLCLLELDPGAVTNEGVTEVEVRIQIGGKEGGRVSQGFPSDIHTFKVAVEGKQAGWLRGAKAYLRLPAKGYERRITVGKDLLQQGRAEKDKTLIRWAMHILGEAREQIPAAAQAKLREVLVIMLEGASLLNDQERVLSLAFEHLSRFTNEDVVLEYVGNLLASRSFGLLTQAEVWYAKATASREAQKQRAAVLIELGRFEEARNLIEGGRTGGGNDVDLLRARTALALGEFEEAEKLVAALTAGEYAVEANQILGGALYAQGKAAESEQAFLAALEADPERSTAYSDLGLALAAQGKAADAVQCFDKAAELDFENTVIPALGKALLKLRAVYQEGGAEAIPEALTELEKLANNNPRNLIVRHYLAYARERSGQLEEAAKLYRSIIDDDYLFRVAIARLGVVQSRRVELGPERVEKIESGIILRVVEDETQRGLIKEAVAHLGKAVWLNPDDAVLPYILGRFLLWTGIDNAHADRMLAKARDLEPPADDPDLPLWARAGRAILLYRNPVMDELKVKSAVAEVTDLIKDQVERASPGNPDEALKKHPVAQFLEVCRRMVEENENKSVLRWDFKTKPSDWEFRIISPMNVAVRDEKIQFRGQVNFHGKQRDHTNVLEHCAIEWPGKNTTERLTGSSFFELRVEGEITPGAPGTDRVDFGVGIVGKGTRRRGPSGCQIKREARNATLEVRLEGGDHDLFKANRARSYIEMTKVSWPAGKFRVRIVVEDRDNGLFALYLKAGDNPEVNVFESQLGIPGGLEKCTLFGKGRGGRPVSVVAWVEGNDGVEFGEIYLDSVRLTKAK
jgi:tetratricopeptide (TPR) repeat protein